MIELKHGLGLGVHQGFQEALDCKLLMKIIAFPGLASFLFPSSWQKSKSSLCLPEKKALAWPKKQPWTGARSRVFSLYYLRPKTNKSFSLCCKCGGCSHGNPAQLSTVDPQGELNWCGEISI